jgi:RimJ/RimL family protein N-acetyltransferase
VKISQLSTVRLDLRPYQESDFEKFAALNADEAVRRHVGGPLSREHAARLFERFASGDCLPGNEVWAIIRKEDREYLGHCWFLQEGTDRPEMGFLLNTRFWRQGYGLEVARALVDYALAGAGYQRIIATVDCNHVASIRILELVGMRCELQEEDEEGMHFVYSIDGAS